MESVSNPSLFPTVCQHCDSKYSSAVCRHWQFQKSAISLFLGGILLLFVWPLLIIFGLVVTHQFSAVADNSQSVVENLDEAFATAAKATTHSPSLGKRLAKTGRRLFRYGLKNKTLGILLSFFLFGPGLVISFCSFRMRRVMHFKCTRCRTTTRVFQPNRRV